jgi:hypothetical protein
MKINMNWGHRGKVEVQLTASLIWPFMGVTVNATLPPLYSWE